MMSFRCFLSFIIATYIIVTSLYFITSPTTTAKAVKKTEKDKEEKLPNAFAAIANLNDGFKKAFSLKLLYMEKPYFWFFLHFLAKKFG